MRMLTAELCDQFGAELQVCHASLRSFGATSAFSGTIATIRCLRDSGLIRDILRQSGAGRVLVVDAGGALDCALVGGDPDRLRIRFNIFNFWQRRCYSRWLAGGLIAVARVSRWSATHGVHLSVSNLALRDRISTRRIGADSCHQSAAHAQAVSCVVLAGREYNSQAGGPWIVAIFIDQVVGAPQLDFANHGEFYG